MKTLSCLLLLSLLIGCAKTEMNAPCPNYGRQCPQTPINAWNDIEEGRKA